MVCLTFSRFSALVVLFHCRYVLAQNATEVLPTFGTAVNILGAMERTDQDFQDGLALDLFSPSNRTLVVQQNNSPLPARFVSGSTGESFVALMNYSYIIKMNETANDLIAKIEIPYDPEMLGKMGIQESNTYVGTLAADKMSWIVDETTRNVHRSENNTRIIKMTSLDGEYMLLGRTSEDTTNIFVQYGQGATRTVNITGGGRQEAEFIDGLRFSIVAPANTSSRMNVDLVNGVDTAGLPAGSVPLNSFSWVVNTSSPNAAMNANIRFPINPSMLVAKTGGAATAKISVVKKPLANGNQLSSAAPSALIVGEASSTFITVNNVMQLDGQYVILVSP